MGFAGVVQVIVVAQVGCTGEVATWETPRHKVRSIGGSSDHISYERRLDDSTQNIRRHRSGRQT